MAASHAALATYQDAPFPLNTRRLIDAFAIACAISA